MSTRPLLLGTLEGYAVEGGFDTPGFPSTCYAAAVSLQRVARPQPTVNILDSYEELLALVPQLGLDGINLTLEWARLAPRPRELDDAAWMRYRHVITHAKDQGLCVYATVVGATWPSWLGPEAWLLPWVEEEFHEHVARVRTNYGDLLDGLVLFADAEQLVRDGFLDGTAPPWRRRARADAASATAQLARMVADAQTIDGIAALTSARSRAVPAALPASALRTVFTSLHDVDVVHVRSLVRGDGPTRTSGGLARFSDSWRIDVPTETIELFRTRG